MNTCLLPWWRQFLPEQVRWVQCLGVWRCHCGHRTCLWLSAGRRTGVDHGAFTVDSKYPSCTQTAAALMDYFRSLQMYMVPVTWEL